MGAIRGISLVLVSVLLFLSLFLTILLGIFGASTDYETFENESVSIAKTIALEYNFTSQIDDVLPTMQLYCQNNSNYVFSIQEYALDIPCDAVLNGRDAIFEEGVKSVIHQIYYKEYSCNFLDCFKQSETPLFLISEKTHNFLNGKFFLFLGISLLLSIGLFFLVKKKANSFIILGALLIIPSLLFFKLNSVFSWIQNEIILSVLNIFFSPSFSISLRVLIVGIAFIILGIVLKIFKVGFFIQDLTLKMEKNQSESSKQKTKSAKIPEKQKSK